jgi:hypothetical protein
LLKTNEFISKISNFLLCFQDDYSLVKFFPLNINNEESIGDLFLMIDTTIQYGEDLEVNTRDFDPPEQDDTEVNSYGFD